MSRFNTPEEVKKWALKTARGDFEKHTKFGVDLNPFTTPGARNDWQRGFDGSPPYSWESQTIEFDTIYQRGKAAAQIVEENK